MTSDRRWVWLGTEGRIGSIRFYQELIFETILFCHLRLLAPTLAQFLCRSPFALSDIKTNCARILAAAKTPLSKNNSREGPRQVFMRNALDRICFPRHEVRGQTGLPSIKRPFRSTPQHSSPYWKRVTWIARH